LSGDGHYLALSTNGTLYSWGRNEAGQLGQGGNVLPGWGGPTFPGTVLPTQDGQWLKVAAGDNHSLAISSDGTLWAWGRNDLWQLGFRSVLGRLRSAASQRESKPVRVDSGHDWAAISGGMLSSIALKRDGSLWSWGGNWTGQLGDGEKRPLREFSAPLEKLPQVTRPTRIGRDLDWTAIWSGAEHVLALKTNGTLWAWGRNDCGQLGLGTFAATNHPVRVGRDSDWVAFSAGGAGWHGGHSAAIKRDGSLWTWGNWRGRTLSKGIADPADTNLLSRPTRLGTDSNWMRVACGNSHGVALKSDGTLWIWGTETSVRLPGLTLPGSDALVVQVGADRDWVAATLDGVGLGSDDTLHALKTDGAVWSWDPMAFPSSAMGGAVATGGPPAPQMQNVPGGTPRQILSLGKSILLSTKPTHAENGSR
jgi:alpha-tubulin suppressor-like RCC1 family protein